MSAIANASEPASSPSLLSPTLRQFAMSPFRVLRLPVNLSTADAALHAETILTLARAGLPPEDRDLLPWLPVGDATDLQKAAQVVEEPLMRLREQLLWFDGVRDERFEALVAAMENPAGNALREYCKADVTLPRPDEETAREIDPALIAVALNQANVRLLVAALRVQGLFLPEADTVPPARALSAADWKTVDSLDLIIEVQDRLISVASADRSGSAANFWQQGLERWVRLLGHPGFRRYVEVLVADLSDDFVTADDAEDVVQFLQVRLAELSAQELRFLLLEGRYETAQEFLAGIVAAGLDARGLASALRPLRSVFQAEISELDLLLTGTGEHRLKHIEAALTRLRSMRQRWQALDPTAALGLGHILDEAVERTYNLVRNGDFSAEKSDELLKRIGELSSAESLRERVGSYRKDLAEMETRLCHWCRTGRPDYEKSVVLEGKKEIDRKREFNSTTITYAIRKGIVLRCSRCARHHQFVEEMSRTAAFATLAALAVPILINIGEIWEESDGRLFFFGLIFIPMITFITVNKIAANVVAPATTPKGFRTYGEFAESEAAKSLRAEGYGITPNFASDAVSSLKEQ